MQNLKMLYNVPIKMRDGVTLYCDVFRPDDDKQYPVLLTRTAYQKDIFYKAGGWAIMSVSDVAAAGYNFVVQDARGTGWSEGDVDSAGNQAEDGYDTIEALAAMPWSDGNVGMVGESFLGYCALEAARLKPPHLRAICPFMCGWRKNPAMYDYGIPTVTQFGWIYGVLETYDRYHHNMSDDVRKKIAYNRTHAQEMMMHLPLIDMPLYNVDGIPQLDAQIKVLENLENLEYFKSVGRENAHEQVDVPMMILTGWMDKERDTTLYNYFQFKQRAGTQVARENVRLIVGPWRHSAQLEGVTDDVDFGLSGWGRGYDIGSKVLAWFDYWLKGKESDYMQGAHVRLFMMGKNEWLESDVYPPAGLEYERYYLHSGGKANTLYGDGELTLQTPGTEQPDHYLYNPANPVPANLSEPMRRTFHDQRPIQRRADVLVYTSQALEQDKVLCGPVSLSLYAASSAVDTDFVGRFTVVKPNGEATLYCEHLVRARFRNGEEPEFLTPEVPYLFNLELGNIALTIPSGHKLRLEITSSLFPVADRNLNTGGRIGFESTYKLAVQTILHDKEHPSTLILPKMATNEIS